MSSFIKEIPRSYLAASILCISLFFVQVIVEILLRTVGGYEEGQVSWAWGIGGSLLIIGIASLGYNYYRYKNGGWYNKTVQTERTTIVSGISDTKQSRSYSGIRIASLCAFIVSLASGIVMLAQPIFGAYWGYGVYVYVVAGVGDQGSLVTAAAVFMILCAVLALVIAAIPYRLNTKHIIPGVVLPLLVFILGLAGLGMAYDEFAGHEWWPEGGFFASVIPSLMAFVFFLIISIKMRK